MIPLKLETLLKGRVVEQDRVEYKEGWNPNEVIQTICAFANDFSNTNGGYIVLGIDAKSDGLPKLPPVGIAKGKLDEIQQKILEYCNFIEPRYLPQIEVKEYQGKYLIYIWCSGGDAGPYSVFKNVLGKKKGDEPKEYYIKFAATKTAAKGSDLFELYNKFNSVPFDDRENRKATIDDIRRAYLEDFLVDSDSSLLPYRNTMAAEDLLLALQVANPTDVGIAIKNIGLLMFCEYPEKYINDAVTKIVWFQDEEEEGSDVFDEVLITGPIHVQIRKALDYMETKIFTERIVKVPGQAEARRFFNYPYAAIEEVLVNAQFHRRYDDCDPVEIRIYPNRIMVSNYPGPDLTIDWDKFCAGKAVAHKYRNKRIGEFLKEIDLSEKLSTGIKKILRALKQNGSPAPLFETEAGRRFLSTTIFMHEEFEPIIVKNIEEVIEDGVDKLPIKVADKLPIKVADKLTPAERRFIESLIPFLHDSEWITNAEARDLSGKSEGSVKRFLRNLTDKGVLEALGEKKNRKYRLVDSKENL
ncbi:MAG: putative DNA binding domain-containing protein [Clostridiales Family XIII bacterium]|nr:putative DNA binding domain-containing protein [Clostridiales Family XIII bacterium]